MEQSAAIKVKTNDEVSLFRRMIAPILSFFLFGFGNIAFNQVAKGFIFLGVQLAMIPAVIILSVRNLGNFATLGTIRQGYEYVRLPPPIDEYIRVTIEGHDSMQMLLLGALTVIVIALFVLFGAFTILNGFQARRRFFQGQRIAGIKEDTKNIIDKGFYKTLLIIPIAGLVVFTIIPLVFMILVGFTSFDRNHPFPELFNWIGFGNFVNLFSGGGDIGGAFFPVLGWTFVWAIFATVTCYFGGIFLAMLINRKGIRGKTFIRTIFVLTIAIPSFITLTTMSSMLDGRGVVNVLLQRWGFTEHPLPFLTETNWARVTVIIVNMWIGIPFTMLFATGVLQNIPEELHESAKIDGANAWVRFRKITMPFVLFVTAPVLVTQFIGNINNFNVIFFLTNGLPLRGDASGAGTTDLLITWLFRLTAETRDFSYASVIGFVVFIINILIALVLFRTKSFRDDTAFRN